MELDLPQLPEFEPLSRERVSFFRERHALLAQSCPAIAKLRSRLLDIGGLELVPQPVADEDVRTTLSQGITFPQQIPIHRKGQPSQCHHNSAKLWLEQVGYNLHTGFGLSDDGLWRCHSWLSKAKTGQLVETTEARLLYHGHTLEGMSAMRFAFSNTHDVNAVKYHPKRIELIKQLLTAR